MRIDIISDVVCPWCLIGKRHLELALAERPDVAAGIHWHPFELNPEVPASGLDRATYWREKFGDPSRLAVMISRLVGVGQELGIEFDFAGISIQPNTRRAHELMHLAAIEGRADAVAEGLFRGFFEQRRDLSRLETLVEIATEAGLDRGAVDDVLRTRRHELDVDAALQAVKRLGVTGVPTFIFAERHALSGAQPPEVLLEVIDHLAGRSASPDAT